MKLIPYLLALLLISCSSSGAKPINLTNIQAAKLEFFETYYFSEIAYSWKTACDWVRDNDTLVRAGKASPNKIDSRGLDKLVLQKGEYVVGYVFEEDIPQVDELLALPEVKKIFSKDLRFLWSYGVEYEENGHKLYALYAIKIPAGNKARVSGKDVEIAEASVSQIDLRPVINITMTKEGSHNWETMTYDNVGRAIAITLDDQVLSCPIVNETIAGGKTEVSGGFNHAEAKELAARISAGISKQLAR